MISLQKHYCNVVRHAINIGYNEFNLLGLAINVATTRFTALEGCQKLMFHAKLTRIENIYLCCSIFMVHLLMAKM